MLCFIGKIKRETEKAVLVPTSITRSDGAEMTVDVWFPLSQVTIDGDRVLVDDLSWIVRAKERDLSDRLSDHFGQCWNFI
jgi:ubiquinone biosynthesis protein UbiJ